MRVLSIPGLLAVLCLAAGNASAEKSANLTWYDTPRDVWIDGVLDRDAQVFSCREPRRLAVVSASLPSVLVVDLSGESVASVPRAAFHVAKDRASATTDAELALTTLCKCHVVDTGNVLLEAEGKTVLLARHQGARGELSEEQLFATVPVWRSLMEGYTPVADALAALQACDADTDVTVVLGTWCGDSKNAVPKLLKALQAAGNPRLKLHLVGLAARFAEPMDVIQGRRIINVPTVIVERGGRELGRIVETPATKTVEEDLAAILAGSPPPHPGRYERERKLAEGTYTLRDHEGRELGTESFELYETKDKGLLVHSRHGGKDDLEVWQGLDAGRRPDFLEVTKRKGEALERARFWRDGKRLSGHLRGSDTGIVDQTLAVPEDVAMLSPSTAAAGLSLGASTTGSKGATPSGFPQAPSGLAYVAGDAMDERLGALRTARAERAGTESVRVPAGEFRAERLVVAGDVDARQLWLHPELGIPVKGVMKDGAELLLTRLHIAAPRAP